MQSPSGEGGSEATGEGRHDETLRQTGPHPGAFFLMLALSGSRFARDGKLLWKMHVGGQVNSGPMSYSVNGRQYVAVAAGTSLFFIRAAVVVFVRALFLGHF